MLFMCAACVRTFPAPLHSHVSAMSISPRRHAGASSQNYSPMCRRHQEDLINAYEAEEERIINVLSRKLEQVCEAWPHGSYWSDLPSSSKKTTFNWKTLSKQSQNPMSTDYRASCPH